MSESRMNEDRLAHHYALCGVALRDGDRDRWLACLFAPEAARPHLFALYAFNAEVARIREHVTQPILGEMRLQWWIDTLTGQGDPHGDLQAHPTADALLATIDTLNLPRQVFRDLLEARRFDMYDDPVPDVGFLEAYCGETCSALFRLASLILGAAAPNADAAGHAGCAYAMTGLLRALPWHVVSQQCYIPRDLLARRGLTPARVMAREKSPEMLAAVADMRALAQDHLAKAKKAVAALPKAEREAYRLLALPRLYLREMERRDYDPFLPAADVAPWRRQWALWREKF
jgi:phytoene synthase